MEESDLLCPLSHSRINIKFTVRFLIKDKIRTKFINSIVGQVHELIIKVIGFRGFIGLSTKPCQSFVIDKNS